MIQDPSLAARLGAGERVTRAASLDGRHVQATFVAAVSFAVANLFVLRLEGRSKRRRPGRRRDDEDGAVSGIAQTLREVTATLEHRPVERLILKLEGRYDRSSAPAFASDELGPGGATLRKRSQLLLRLGAVARF